MMRSIAVGLAILWLASPSRGQVECPRVLSEHVADTTDLARFRNFAAWKDKTGNALAVAVWQYLCDNRTGLYHMNEVCDGPDPSSEYATVRDPLKILNVYGVGYCGIFGPTTAGIYKGMGFPDARSFGVVDYSHNATEVFYDNAWHYLDVDLRGALLKADGTVASLAEVRAQRGLWTNPPVKVSPFFPHDPNRGRIYDIYHKSQINFDYRWFQMGHTMDFSLRPGESFTRWWHPQGGRWRQLPSYARSAWLMKLIEQPPAGFKSNHADFSVWTQGNGLWHYAPNLAAASSDFARGVYSSAGLAPGREGLTLTAAHGQAVFEVFTPYIIVPKVNAIADPDDDTDAATLTLDAAAAVAVAVSTDHGYTWREAATCQPGRSTLDLTRWVKGTYGYLIRLSADGKAGDAVVRSLALDTWVQCAPAALPRLDKGVNHCSYQAGDRYGLVTRPTIYAPDFTDRAALAQFVKELPAAYTPDKLSSRCRGDVVARFDAPAGRKISWLTVGAAFTTHQNAAAAKTDNRIAYAVGQPTGFKEVYKADVPAWVNHWRYQWDQDIRLDAPADTVYVRYTGNPAVDQIRATLHCVAAADQPTDTAVEITHAFRIGGKVIEKTVAMDRPGDYTIQCDGDPENVFVRLAVPSSK
ncbi:MAG: hypothetical protein BIFFINMI_03489 [Phycisphaerae bacterium]|nr:hypothetical protein [Phycisphaerae bacterium]